MYAIVSTGGKQYKVAEDDVIEVEKLPAAVGDTVMFDVLLFSDGKTIVTDAGTLAAQKVSAEVLEQFRGEKQLVFKFKKRKGYKRLKGHRQDLTRVQILSVDGKPATKKVAPAKAEAKEVAPIDEAAEKKPAAKKAAAKKTSDAAQEDAAAEK